MSRSVIIAIEIKSVGAAKQKECVRWFIAIAIHTDDDTTHRCRRRITHSTWLLRDLTSKRCCEKCIWSEKKISKNEIEQQQQQKRWKWLYTFLSPQFFFLSHKVNGTNQKLIKHDCKISGVLRWTMASD